MTPEFSASREGAAALPWQPIGGVLKTSRAKAGEEP